MAHFKGDGMPLKVDETPTSIYYKSILSAYAFSTAPLTLIGLGTQHLLNLNGLLDSQMQSGRHLQCTDDSTKIEPGIYFALIEPSRFPNRACETPETERSRHLGDSECPSAFATL
ncbi:hypothetical protein ACEPPN_005207 [Leptodophora sp. 'Broadleaf-Isolate-01']